MWIHFIPLLWDPIPHVALHDFQGFGAHTNWTGVSVLGGDMVGTDVVRVFVVGGIVVGGKVVVGRKVVGRVVGLFNKAAMTVFITKWTKTACRPLTLGRVQHHTLFCSGAVEMLHTDLCFYLSLLSYGCTSLLSSEIPHHRSLSMLSTSSFPIHMVSQ